MERHRREREEDAVFRAAIEELNDELARRTPDEMAEAFSRLAHPDALPHPFWNPPVKCPHEMALR